MGKFNWYRAPGSLQKAIHKDIVYSIWETKFMDIEKLQLSIYECSEVCPYRPICRVKFDTLEEAKRFAENFYD